MRSRHDETREDTKSLPTATGNATQLCQGGVTTDPGLAAVLEAWPNLPDAIKAGVVAMVKASGAHRSC